jgi:CBS domain-containing protein
LPHFGFSTAPVKSEDNIKPDECNASVAAQSRNAEQLSYMFRVIFGCKPFKAILTLWTTLRWGGAMKVEELIHARKDIYSIHDDATVHEAARYLREKQVRAVGVRDRQEKLVGVISHSDISDQVAAENKCPAWTRVSEIMSTDLIVVPPETPLDECLRLMEKHGFFHLPVVDATGDYRGMVSVKDLLKVIASDEKARADMLESFLFSQR